MSHISYFNIANDAEFSASALEVFGYQFDQNPVYREFCTYLGKDRSNVERLEDIPFLPISFFKSKKVICGSFSPDIVFTSSGTTGNEVSRHYVKDLALYEESYLTAFRQFYGPIEDYCILALLPSYLEREGSSLIYMANDLIKKSGHPDSGFYLDHFDRLYRLLAKLEATGTKVLLLGVSFALLDMAESYKLTLRNTVIMETGGMKGRRREMIREELHHILRTGFGVPHIHSEYGMTELLSQAYSHRNGRFTAPSWMKVLARETEDPLTLLGPGKTGGINIIDLANLHSCAFIATQDLGKVYKDGSFEISGRFDHSDIRGCNLMVL